MKHVNVISYVIVLCLTSSPISEIPRVPEIFLRFCESIFVVWQVENIGKRKKSGQLLSVSFEELREQAERLVSEHFFYYNEW